MVEKVKIFIVDDAIAARKMLSNILGKLENVEVVGEASTGPGAVIMLEEVLPDVMFVESPIEGNMAIEEVIKESLNILEKVKIIICADSRTSENDIRRALEAGAVDFIRKPYHQGNIMRVMRETLGL